MFLITLFVIIIILYLYFKRNNIDYENENTNNLLKNKIKHKNKIRNTNVYEKRKINFNNKSNNSKKTNKKNKSKKTNKTKKDLVYFDITSDGNFIGRITMQLFDEIVPKTCFNFRSLCKNKSYCNAPFHRIIKDFMIQGGDYTNGNGTGGRSIWGGKFEDENFNIPHNQPYLLSMANSGPNTNGSQFFITTTNEASHLDGMHVVFGKIIDGFDTVDELNETETDHENKPLQNIIISDCGEI